MTMSVSRKTASSFDLFKHYSGVGMEAWLSLSNKGREDWYAAWKQSDRVNIQLVLNMDGVYDLEDEDQIHNCTEPSAIYRKPSMVGLSVFVKQPTPWAVAAAVAPKYVDPIDHSKYKVINSRN